MKYVWVLWAVNVSTDLYTFEVIRVYPSEGEEVPERGASDKRLSINSNDGRKFFLDRHEVTA